MLANLLLPGDPTTPGRIRRPLAALAALAMVAVLVLGVQATLATGVGAVVLNITVTGPTTGGYLTVHPTGTTRPNASNLNFTAGQTIANLVIAKVGTNGQISIHNEFGTTHVIADIAGWLPAQPRA